MKKYDLEERTFLFGKNIVLLTKSIKLTYYNKNILDQLLRSATSVGANYAEANGASSSKDFRNKCYLCKKEAKESYYWLNLLVVVEIHKNKEINILLKESLELSLIFGKISSSLLKN